MISILVAVLLTGMFFVLFFVSPWNSKNKREKKRKRVQIEPSTTRGFIEDTADAFIIPMFPTQLMRRDISGKMIVPGGKTRYFAPHSSIPENHWLHGFPHKKTK
jgi:hypothetical protein